MSAQNGKDFLFLTWKDPKTRRNFIVGSLSKNGCFEFKYSDEIYDAIRCGFELLASFDDIDKTYCSDVLFPSFSSRLPDKKRRDISAILSKYGIQNYDEFELLKKSGAKLPIDSMEFVDPIFEDETDVKRVFYLAGVRYYLGCAGETCENAYKLLVGSNLTLVPEPTNESDPNAIKVCSHDGSLVGYIPRYFCKGILSLINNSINYFIEILEINKDQHCNECIRVQLTASR
jgi:hypothetical protein